MRIRLGYQQAEVWYDDGVKRPTPEHVDDLLKRLERSLQRIWEGNAPQQIDLDEYEHTTEPE